jgi:cyanophycinase
MFIFTVKPDNPIPMQVKCIITLFLCALTGTAQAQERIFPYPGKLIIIGGGSIPDTIYTAFAASIGGRDQPVVYIPTATGDEDWIRQGGHLQKFLDHGFTNLQTVHTRNRDSADTPAFLERIRKANGVFFGGGDQSRLADAYLGTRLHRELTALLERGGTLMGTSAGASIMGSLLVGGDHRKTPDRKVQLPEGLAFMKHTAIDQHVLVRNRAFDLIPVLENHPGTFGISIDESTAAVVTSNEIRVIGQSYMMTYDPVDWKAQMEKWGRILMPFRFHAPGGRFDLTGR